ncbi:hypothetical protein NDU88_003410, partial [Pleurodeles waltl]
MDRGVFKEERKAGKQLLSPVLPARRLVKRKCEISLRTHSFLRPMTRKCWQWRQVTPVRVVDVIP